MSETTPEDGMTLTRDTVFKPGVYFLPNGIAIARDGIELDGNGALLIGADFVGAGVTIKRQSGVKIRRLQLERYYHGISALGCANLSIEDCAITRTHELAGPGVFLDVWLDRSQVYGGAIFLNGVTDSRISRNDVRHQQSGILLYGCQNVLVDDNNASYNSGYGMMLFESSNNQVLDNIADYCCRIYQSGVAQERYHNGADAAALVMMCSSCGNTVRGNLLRSSGDGVFLGGFHKDLIPTPCNNNVFERNDGSDSPNIAFEATFSQHNIFRDNRANNCNYGFWLGWSSHNTVESNRIHNSRIAGIAIEHGHHNTLAANDIERNRSGIQLWTNADDARSAGLFRTYFPECAESHATLLGKNHITACETAIHAWTQREEPPVSRCHGFTLDNNILTGNRVAVLFERVRESRIARNQIVDNVEAGIKLIGSPDVLIDSNTMDRNGQAA